MGYFIQLLEGDQATVIDLIEKISKDPRHRDIEIVLDFVSPSRLFPQWSMGVIPIDEDANQLASVVKTLSRQKVKFQDAMASDAIKVLTAFSKKYSKSSAL